MESWIAESLQGDELLQVSATGYINECLGLEYLEHFIKHTKASSKSPMKLLLMDGHASHKAPGFVLLAHKHNVIPYTFPSHLTHVMQPLDVGIFQPYKHWHKVAIEHAMRNLNVDYNIASFLQDLTKIRHQTFRIGTVKSAWRKAGLWPLSCKQTLAQMKLYSRQLQAPKLPTPPPPATPQKFAHAERGLQHWDTRIPELLSSPSRQQFNSWSRGTQAVLAGGYIKDMELEQLLDRVQAQQKAKARSRKSLQKGGQLTVAEAKQKIKEKLAKEQALLQAQKDRQIKKLRKAEMDLLHRQGVNARKAERLRKKQVLELTKAKMPIPDELRIAILDPEKLAKELAEQQAKMQVEQGDGFIAFESPSSGIDTETDEDDRHTDDEIETGLF